MLRGLPSCVSKFGRTRRRTRTRHIHTHNQARHTPQQKARQGKLPEPNAASRRAVPPWLVGWWLRVAIGFALPRSKRCRQCRRWGRCCCSCWGWFSPYRLQVTCLRPHHPSILVRRSHREEPFHWIRAALSSHHLHHQMRERQAYRIHHLHHQGRRAHRRHLVHQGHYQGAVAVV